MKNDEENSDKMKDKSGFTSSESTGDSTNKNLHDWNKLYAEMNVEDMHWYLP